MHSRARHPFVVTPSTMSIPTPLPSGFLPPPPAQSLVGLTHPSPVPAINHHALRLTKEFRRELYRLRDDLPCELSVSSNQACRLVALTPCGEVLVLRLCELEKIPEFSIISIAAFDVLQRSHGIRPRANDIMFLSDLSDRSGLIFIPNLVRSWIDNGNYRGLYADLSLHELIAVVHHLRTTLGFVPDHSELRKALKARIKERH